MVSDFGNSTYLPPNRTSFMDVPLMKVKLVKLNRKRKKYLLFSELFDLVAYSGPRTFANGKFEEKIQVCGLVPKCLDCIFHQKMSGLSFEYLDMEGNFQENASVMPLGLDADLFPILNFNYKKFKSQLDILQYCI